MKKIKLISIFSFLILFGFSMISLTQSVNARRPPFMDDLDPTQRIYFWIDSDISASKESWFYAGMYFTPYELEYNWFPKNPYKIKLFINEEEIPLRRYALYEKEFETSIPYKIGDTWYYDAEPIITERHAWFWYQIFKPNYFKSGTTYVIRMEVWVHSPYGGSEETGWRIYINYIGPELGYGPYFPEIAGIYERYIHVTD
jgi:hypothetical protein